jgi:hypothetical protein
MLRIVMALCLLLLTAAAYDLVGTEVSADNSFVGSTNNFSGDASSDCSPAAAPCVKTERVFYRGRWYVRCVDCETHGVGPDGLPLQRAAAPCPTCPQQARQSSGTYRTYSTSYSSGGRFFNGRFRGKIFSGKIRAWVRERFSGRGSCGSCG